MEVKYTPEASMFLFIQKGELQRAWQQAYETDLEEAFHAMRPHLPPHCKKILDIGGGMGGIDILLAMHYGARVTIIDGIDDPPIVEAHRKSFSSARAAREFLNANGVEVDFEPKGKYDLVISLRAWCFHIPPGDYRELVNIHTYSNTRVIADVRHGWEPPFKEIATISDNGKCRRLVMRT